MPEHRDLAGNSLHLPFHYVQTTDPGAVGAGKWWANTTNNTTNRRNDANTAWLSFGGASGGSDQIATLQHRLTAGNILASVGGSWGIIPINTIVANQGNFVSLASNVITLGVGSYFLQFSKTFFSVDRYKTRLWNVTTSAEIERGTTCASNTNTGSSSHLFMLLTLAVSTQLRFEYLCGVSHSEGLGMYAPYPIGSGGDEVNMHLAITKKG